MKSTRGGATCDLHSETEFLCVKKNKKEEQMKYFSMEFSYVIPECWRSGRKKAKEERGEMMVVLSGAGELTDGDLDVARDIVYEKLDAMRISDYRMIAGALVSRKVFADYLFELAEREVPFRRLKNGKSKARSEGIPLANRGIYVRL
jgi:hypothetical protein